MNASGDTSVAANIKRVVLALISLSITPCLALSDWRAEPGTVKILVKKRLAIPAISRQTTAVPQGILQRWSAVLVDESSSYLVVQVPVSNSADLRSELLAVTDSVSIRDDFDILDFRTLLVDARLPAAPYPAQWSRTATIPPPARDAFLLQFASVPRPEWLADLTSVGATIIDYLPQNGYFVLAASDAIQGVAARTPVQLLRIHQPIHKISGRTLATAGSFSDVTVSIATVLEAAEARAFLLANSTAELHPTEDTGDREFHSVTLSSAALPELASFSAVIWIEPYSRPLPSGEREARLAVGDTLVSNVSNVLKPLPNVDYRDWIAGKGVANYKTATKVAVLDAGFDLGSTSNAHRDFLGGTGAGFVEPVSYTNAGGANNDCNGHGTMVAGALVGNAGGPLSTSRKDTGSLFGDFDYLMGLGAVPEMPLVAGRIFNYLTVPPPGVQPPAFDPRKWQTIYGDLLNRGVGITSNSWNDTTERTYNSLAQIMDKIVRSANGVNGGPPMTVYFSAGNNEYPAFRPEVRAPATAKNVISVGGSENFNPNNNSMSKGVDYNDPPADPAATTGPYADNGNEVWAQSAAGFTVADSRIKPDIVAPASAIEGPRTRDTSACQAGFVGSVIDSAADPMERHIWSRGTSFSSPIAAGVGALLYTWYKNKTGGEAPNPSLLKAMQINFAYDMTGAGLGRPPDTRQGWGKVDLKRAFQTDGRYDWDNQDSYTLLTSSGSSQYFPSIVGRYRMKDLKAPVRITVVWTDRFSSMLTSTALVNDLNLKVHMYGTGTYAIGNDFNPATGRSTIYTAGGKYNTNDNVEQVVFMYGDVGTDQFVVEVNGAAIVGDALNVWKSFTETPRQDFAIFIDNVVGR